MGKPSDEMIHLKAKTVTVTGSFVDDGPLSISPLMARGWADGQIYIARDELGATYLKYVYESAEEIEAEYNRAVEAGKDE